MYFYLSTLGKPMEILMCFSLTRNTHALLETRDPPHAVTCLHGMRVLSMAWIVLGHTFLATYSTGAVGLYIFVF